MADTIVNKRPVGKQNVATRYVVTAEDVVNGAIVFNFQIPFELACNIMVTDATDIYVDLADAEITYPEAGQIRIANNGTFALTEDYTISLVGSKV